MKKLFIGSLLITFTAIPAIAATAFSDGKDAIEYRQNAFQLIRHNTGDIGDMLQGKVKFDQARLQRRADALVGLSALPWEGFTIAGANQASGDAKAEIWSDAADFQAKVDKFQAAAKALQAAAQTSDQAKIKTAFMDFRGNCKACHDKYKAD